MKILETIPDFEDGLTVNLFYELRHIKSQGYLTKSEFLKIAKWKSPRPINFYLQNDELTIRRVTELAFQITDDNIKIHILTSLVGVNIPTASAILMFYDKEKFPVIDIRVWTQLYKMQQVSENEKGQAFTLNQWRLYLQIIRKFASLLNVSARQIEKRLFDYDKKNQTKPIYSILDKTNL